MLSKRSALRVSEAMDVVEEFIGEAAELLEQVDITATEARKIPDIPEYLDEHLIRLINNMERINYVSNAIKAVRQSLADGDLERINYVSNAIKAVRQSLANGEVNDERKRRESSRQPILVA